jgi:ERCC4-type nuclease
LDHFGSFERVRTATVEALQEVEGIGPKLAAELRAFLDALAAQGEPPANDRTDRTDAPDPTDRSDQN